MRLTALLLACTLASSALAASPPWLNGVALHNPATSTELPAIDAEKLILADLDAPKLGAPRRIGLLSRVEDLGVSNPTKRADWQRLDDGRMLWRTLIQAPGARGIDVSFSDYRLPAGAELWIRNRKGDAWHGPYTDAHNAADGRLFTPLLAGDTAVVELLVPEIKQAFVRLEIGTVTRAYRDVFPDAFEKQVAAKSGSCNVDVACPEGNPWRDQINSVAHYTFQSGGTFVCTGQLAATSNTANDTLSPTFLTAHHCVSTQAEVGSMVFYWKYESPSCRTPGSASSGSPLNKPSNTAATQSGASLLATHAQTDFTVIRLSNAVPTAAQAYWSGWDRREASPSGSVTIHHPAGHEKRISFNDDALTVTPSCILGGTPSNTHWRVDNWELGTTEGGSSGSGLWSPDNQLLIGVLSGGEASCATISFDCYGRLATAWEGGGAAASRVRDWLDPASSGAQTLAGHSAMAGLNTTLNSPAFTTPPAAGSLFTLTATASSGNGSYTYEWDTNGDGIYERSSTSATLQLSYPTATSTQVSVRVRDSAGAVGTTSRALDVAGPRITAAAAGAATQVCGNSDGNFDPGERWQLPVRLSNTGGGSLQSGHALFAAGDALAASLPFGPDAFGYRASSSSNGGCSHSWIDISGEAPLTLSPIYTNTSTNDEGRAQITLQGGDSFSFYGEAYTQLVASTNGYLALGTADNGGDFNDSCSSSERGSGPRMQVLHDDLTLNGGVGAGIRYRRFASCPRAGDRGSAGQACHVVTWSGMQPLGGSGSDEFQAVLYPATGQIVYQYRTVQSGNAFSASIGIAKDEEFSDKLNLACNSTSAATSGSAFCVFEPGSGGSTQAAVVLNAPTVAFGGIAAAGNATVNLPFEIDPAASCGAAFAIDHIASADASRHSVNIGTVLQGSVDAGCSVVNSCQPLDLVAEPQRGLYFSDQRPGNGMNGYFYDLEGSNRLFAGLWYTADLERRSAWYLVNGIVNGYGGQLPLSLVTNQGTSTAINPAFSTVGRAWVGQIDAETLLFAWEFNDGRRGAERMNTVPFSVFDRPGSTQNHTQAWFNPSEDGWGVAIESLTSGAPPAPFEFFADYIFDAAGNPRWVVGDKSSLGSGTVNLTDVKAHCPGCAFFPDYESFNGNAGSMNIQYTTRSSATLSTSIQLPAPLSGSWIRNATPIVPIAEPTP